MTDFINPLEIFPDQAEPEKESKERMYPLGIPESKIIAFNKEMNKQVKKPDLLNYIEWEYGAEVLSEIFKSK